MVGGGGVTCCCECNAVTCIIKFVGGGWRTRKGRRGGWWRTSR